MKNEDNKLIVVWDNPRRVELCKVIGNLNGLVRVELEKNGITLWRKPKMVFDDQEAVDKYLEIEDYKSIH